MHVALVHDAVVPPQKYGGTERIIYWLAKALMQMGHRVTLIARAGSHVPGVQFIEYPGNRWEDALPSGVDLTHLWSTPHVAPRGPFVVTIEGNGQPGEKFLPQTIFISRKHAENHGSGVFVYNGIDPDDYDCPTERQNGLVFLAKASWKVKNLEGAIAIAQAAGLPLDVLGSRDWPLGLHKLRPRINGIRFHGMADDRTKRKYLARARALLFPVRWHEPFGIAIVEALASGCAVLGTPYGSLPEIVTPEVGVLSTRTEDLVAALRDPHRFSPQTCRARVYQGFTHLDMARSYVAQYESILKTGQLTNVTTTTPQTRPGFSAQELLPWH